MVWDKLQQQITEDADVYATLGLMHRWLQLEVPEHLLPYQRDLERRVRESMNVLRRRHFDSTL